ncbi:glycosyltransferase family 4 protein [Bradyrhizobium diazoefficiens]|nr:glycosyltransferase family 1 protein [Bradyrhizobium diazoefficiens]QQN65742.1 glycosyltransferase family 4 protein [Bradyrhizobium diazoefficiens]
MRIALSANFVKPGRVGGVEQAFYNLAYGLLDCGAEVTIVAATPTRLPDETKKRLSRGGAKLKYLGGLENRFVAEEMFALSCRDAFDATIFPNYYLPLVSNSRFGKKIVIVHDLQHLHYPNNFSIQKKLWLRYNLARSLNLSDATVCISEATYCDIRSHYGRTKSRLEVIQNAVDWSRFETGASANAGQSERPYILSVAHHFPHKNLETLIRAVGKVAQRVPSIRLVLVGQSSANLGSGSYTDRLNEVISTCGLQNLVMFTGHIDDATLGELYKSATLFCFPSLFEGFGLPPVEAMGLGSAAIVSDIAALREVTLGLANYVSDPRSVDEWADQIHAVLSRSISREASGAIAGKLREAYSGRAIAEKYLDLIHDLVVR